MIHWIDYNKSFSPITNRRGWKYICYHLQNKLNDFNYLYNFDNIDILIDSYIDMTFRNTLFDPVYCVSWIGFLHYFNNKLFKNKNFIKSLYKCVYLVVFSKHLKNKLINAFKLHNIKFDINNIIVIYLPSETNNITYWTPFSKYLLWVWKPSILWIGDRYRNFVIYNALPKNNSLYKDKICINKCHSYDNLLDYNIVVLNITDCVISHTVVECINKNVPVIINRLPILEEYLGIDYPLFYENGKNTYNTIKNIEYLMTTDKIYNAYLYLKNKNKQFINIKAFIIRFTDLLSNIPTYTVSYTPNYTPNYTHSYKKTKFLLKTVFTTLPTEICDHIAIYLTDIYDIESMKPYISNYIYKKLIKMT